MPSVFFSYKHESSEHKARVRCFADSLKSLGCSVGVTVVLDQYFAETHPAGPDEGWEIWSENQAAKCDFILLVASPEYYLGYNLNHTPGTAPGIIPEIFIIRKRVRQDGYQPHTVRPLVLQTSDISSVPDALSHLQRFNENDATNVLKWMNGDCVFTTATSEWFSATPSLDHCLVADCKEVLTAYAALIVEAATKRILLIKGGSGLGKTTLIDELAALRSSREIGPICSSLDLKGGLIERSLEPFARKLGLLSVYLGTKGLSPLDRFSRLFSELETNKKAHVLLFDTFESGGVYAQWIEQNVLPVAATSNWLRVVIAGKEVPNPLIAQSAAWRNVAVAHNLRNLEWSDWRILAAKLRPELIDDDIQKLCNFACGNHHAIRAVLGVTPIC